MKSLKPSDSITGLLNRIDGQDDQEHLMRTIYDHLHRTAQNLLRHERPNHTLCPTDLIGESYAKLFLNQKLSVVDRNHFFSIAANAMRQILIDHARSKKRLKRNGIQITLSWVDKGRHEQENALDILEIENALVQSGAINFIKHHSQGINMQVGEGGRFLSGGQKHRPHRGRHKGSCWAWPR